jgi:PAS domain-containing protein
LSLDIQTIAGLLAISLFSAFLAVFVVGRIERPKRLATAARIAGDATATRFVFEGTKLVDATPAALTLIDAPVDRNQVWAALQKKIELRFSGATAKLDLLADQGVEFNLRGEDQTFLTGRLTDIGFEVELGQNKPLAPTASVEQQAIGLQFKELMFLREICNLSPILIWQQGEGGNIRWANRAYRQALSDIKPDCATDMPPYAPLFDQIAMTTTEPMRHSLDIPGTNKPQWFEISTHEQQSGDVLCFAFHADPVVRAEEALRNFVQTLTMTFAHLPTGLAIFDRNRQLALFNPALADLTTLDPAWLTARPSLTAFLDRLRENRHVPEPKNYKSWRDRIQALEQAAEDGTYEENWPLPTGQTYRVTGRPHPEGAVAFLFEDITSNISLQRQFRSELELGQSVLDSQDKAVAVFAALGDLVMSNDGFANLWGVDPREMLARLGASEAAKIWRDLCEPSPIWDDFLAFAAKPGERTNWRGQVRLKTGQGLLLEVKTLPHGAFLCEFTAAGPVFARAQQKSLARA